MRKLVILICLLCCMTFAYGQSTRPWFHRLTYNDGLSDNKVNCILKSRDGFLWIGTPMGLNRFDGYRVRSFFSRPGVSTSLPDNAILSLAEDKKGMLWVETENGTCIFNPHTNQVDRDVKGWMTRHGVRKPALKARQGDGFFHFTDSRGGKWRWTQQGAFHYDKVSRQWKRIDNYMVKDVAEDHEGNILIATDHDGLLVADYGGNIVQHLINNPADAYSLPDNTLQCVYVDDAGVVWLGMYRMGLAWYYRGQSQFDLLNLGDVCTMAQNLSATQNDADGGNSTIWLGTNDAGIKRYDFKSQSAATIGKAKSGLGSDAVVSSLAASDGSLWFGTFQGGMARMQGGRYTHFKKSEGGLASNDVWALAEIPQKGSKNRLIAIGTLGGGLQIMSHNSFETFDTINSNLPSDYIVSISVLKDGRLALGHSKGVTLFNWHTGAVYNIDGQPRKDGGILTSLFVNQVFTDSRGLLWIATGAGLNVYDTKADRLYTVNLHGTHVHEEVSAICEDHDGGMWLTIGNEVKNVKVRRSGGSLQFFIDTYTAFNGLQSRIFNKRSILCLHDGRILVGGIDGVNVINPKNVKQQTVRSKVIFSGFSLFDHTVAVGDSINGHVILSAELNDVRQLILLHNENTFTIQMASSNPGLPSQPDFFYRINGGRWMMTSTHEPSVQFNNLSPGRYILEVQAMGDGGSYASDIATLQIIIKPPFYRSFWAYLLYIVMAALFVWYVVWRSRKNHRDEMEKLELRKEKEIEEAKMTFFTNISHELRTPLSLILSPVESLLGQAHDTGLQDKLRLIRRNARHLLTLTNQMLDLRRIASGKEVLHLAQDDIVEVVRSVCSDFTGLSDKGITLTFKTSAEHFYLPFDKDKIEKIVYNLLSNAYKFTPNGGCVSVSLTPTLSKGEGDSTQNEFISIIVADNGPGISDEDKRHVFDRFYQSKANKQSGGSGIGLNLVYEYAKMHGGSVTITDNSPNGAVFTVTLPLTDSTENEKKGGYVTSFSLSTIVDVHDEVLGSDQDKASSSSLVEGQNGTLLLVDDNDDFLTFLSSELAPYYNIQTANDGQQALDSIRKSRPDLVLTDIMMPVMDGNELCRRIKADDCSRDLPVVMLTARLSDENEIESRECGADDYVKKPFSLQLLRMHIDALLDKNRVGADGKVQPRIAQPKITSEDERFVDKATKYIERHLDDTSLNVEQMASDIGMSRVQLYRRLVSVAGKTPSEFIRLVRLRHAARLLKESQSPVSEIAYKVGFASPRYFSKCFKELYGYMPTEYKRN